MPVTWLESEVLIDGLDNNKIRPDYIIFRNNTRNNTIKVGDVIKDTPLFVIEAKKGDQQNLKNKLPQNYMQLREICIKHHLPFCHGILTNGLHWYFTRYSLASELKSLDGSFKGAFQHSDMFEVVERVANWDNVVDHLINQSQLVQVLKIIEMLPVYCSTALKSQEWYFRFYLIS